MKKGQEGPGLLVTLIVAVLVLAILGGFYIALRTFVSAGSNIEAMRTWVELRGATGATDIAVSAVPPVTDLEKPLKIKSQEELVWKGGKPPEAYKEIADSMVDCWNAFNNGETDFLNSIKKETFCFPCRAVTFSDEIKKNNLKISGLNKYLNEQHVRGENSPTYLQILANDKTYVLEEADLEDDEIIINDDLYIFFFAASGRGWVNILSNVIGGGDIVEENPSEGKIISTATQQEGTGDIQAVRAGAVLGGELAGKATLPTLARKLTETSVPSAAATSYEQVLFTAANREIKEDAAKIVLVAESKASQKTVQGVLGRALGRILTNNGVKFIAAKTFLPVTIISSAVGTYEIIWGDKPFSAKVLIVDPNKVYEICNA